MFTANLHISCFYEGLALCMKPWVKRPHFTFPIQLSQVYLPMINFMVVINYMMVLKIRALKTTKTREKRIDQTGNA